jgi:uncharacterized membrane protein YuzA (DUF378 family)
MKGLPINCARRHTVSRKCSNFASDHEGQAPQGPSFQGPQFDESDPGYPGTQLKKGSLKSLCPHEISERLQVQAVFQLCSLRLRNDALYDEVRDEIREMSHYLDSDSQRRQSNTVMRLTVITILGLIATVTTGYFGMNIIAFGEGSVFMRLLHGVIATSVAVALVLFAITRSKQLSDFLEALADEKVSKRKKIKVFGRIFRRSERVDD